MFQFDDTLLCIMIFYNLKKSWKILNKDYKYNLKNDQILIDWLTGTKKYEHITPVLASLHWLPVCFRIEFKILLIVFKILHGLAPANLSELSHIHTPVRALRSSNQVLLDVLRARLKNKGDQAFSVVAPNLSNSLPVHIRTAQSVGIFKSFLKTHLYSLAFILSWVETLGRFTVFILFVWEIFWTLWITLVNHGCF